MSLLDDDFFTSTPEPIEKLAIKEPNRREMVKNELHSIFLKHNLNPQEGSIIEELAEIYCDAPPWSPWA